MNSIVIALDIDGTVLKNGWPRVDSEAVPLALWCLKRADWLFDIKYIVNTCRDSEGSEFAAGWLRDNGVPVWAVNEHPHQASMWETKKVYADIYLDDKALGTPLLPDGCIDWFEYGPALLRRCAEIAKSRQRDYDETDRQRELAEALKDTLE